MMFMRLFVAQLLVSSCVLVSVVSAKEFADCGSTALMPIDLELSPDPAEVRVSVRNMYASSLLSAAETSSCDVSGISALESDTILIRN